MARGKIKVVLNEDTHTNRNTWVADHATILNNRGWYKISDRRIKLFVSGRDYYKSGSIFGNNKK